MTSIAFNMFTLSDNVASTGNSILGTFRRENPHIRPAEGVVNTQPMTNLQWKYAQLCNAGNSFSCEIAPLLEELALMNVKTPKDLQWLLEDYHFASLDELWQFYQAYGKVVPQVKFKK
ncbi:MAG: hypothetical protein HZA83_02190 [Thaumarchaeota archaeon]|nr:hypothetical protein [Nitrososphaerota archaeon]